MTNRSTHTEEELLETKAYRIDQPVPFPAWLGYGVAVFTVGLITAGLLALGPHFPLFRYPIPYVVGIMLVAYFFGEGPAILAFLLGATVFDYFFIPPAHTLFSFSRTSSGWAAMTAFLIGTSVVGFGTLLIRRSNHRLQRIALRLQQSQDLLERYKLLAKYANDIMLFINPDDGRIIEANEAAARVYGYTRDELLSATVFDLRKAAATSPVLTQLAKAQSEGIVFEAIHRRKDGTTFPVEVSSRGATFGGKLVLLSIIRDITERKQAEEREHQSEKHKLDFYRRTILAATDNKLVIADQSDIDKITREPILTWKIRNATDLSNIRNEAGRVAAAEGMSRDRLEKLLICIGEACANTIKHAGRGSVSIYKSNGNLLVSVRDAGHGIDALNIPDVALRNRYSTAGTLGMGYKIMIAFADKLYLATGPQGTNVAIEVAVNPSRVNELSTV